MSGNTRYDFSLDIHFLLHIEQLEKKLNLLEIIVIYW